MSLDRTLKLKGGLRGSRSVLSRAERIAQLATEGKFDPEKDNPLGLPKVKVRHSRAGSKAKKEAVAEDGEEGAEEAAKE
jgi:small basic protein (TIGR04137 family)